MYILLCQKYGHHIKIYQAKKILATEITKASYSLNIKSSNIPLEKW